MAQLVTPFLQRLYQGLELEVNWRDKGTNLSFFYDTTLLYTLNSGIILKVIYVNFTNIMQLFQFAPFPYWDSSWYR